VAGATPLYLQEKTHTSTQLDLLQQLLRMPPPCRSVDSRQQARQPYIAHRCCKCYCCCDLMNPPSPHLEPPPPLTKDPPHPQTPSKTAHNRLIPSKRTPGSAAAAAARADPVPRC
jgi:hypothetical protein